MVGVERAPALVTYANPVVTGGTDPVVTTCTASSGASFPAGVTDVVCSATDAIQRKAQCIFHVSVNLTGRLKGTSFLAFGDSITEGEVSVPFTTVLDLQPQNSYPTVLLSLLKAGYPLQASALTMANAGSSGKKATADEDRFVDEVGTVRPDAVLLLEGANDVNDGIAPDKIVGALRGDVRRAFARFGVKAVFWSTLLPEVPGRSKAANPEGILVVNDLIRSAAAAEGAVLVDAWAAFEPQKELLIGADGLHPTVQGYAKLAEVYLSAIAAAFQQPPAGAGLTLFSAPESASRAGTRAR